MHFEISGKVCVYQKVSNGSGFLLFSFISLSETAEQVLRHLKLIQHVSVKRAAFLAQNNPSSKHIIVRMIR